MSSSKSAWSRFNQAASWSFKKRGWLARGICHDLPTTCSNIFSHWLSKMLATAPAIPYTIPRSSLMGISSGGERCLTCKGGLKEKTWVSQLPLSFCILQGFFSKQIGLLMTFAFCFFVGSSTHALCFWPSNIHCCRFLASVSPQKLGIVGCKTHQNPVKVLASSFVLQMDVRALWIPCSKTTLWMLPPLKLRWNSSHSMSCLSPCIHNFYKACFCRKALIWCLVV